MTSTTPERRIVVALSGASGAVYGVRLLQALRDIPSVQTHLTVSDAAWLNVRHELDLGPGDLEPLAHVTYPVADVGAAIASGSFRADAMVIAPCSMRTLAAVAHGLADNLITRAADVMLKERRRLVLLARETPLSLVHLRNMVSVTEMGAIVAPPVPAFYARPQNLEEMVDHTLGRVLDLFDIDSQTVRRWAGTGSRPTT